MTYGEKIKFLDPTSLGFSKLEVVNNVVGYYADTGSDEPTFMEVSKYKDV